MELPPIPHYFSSEHEQYRSSLREFVNREIVPFVNDWDEAETFPRDLYRKFGDLGALGIGYEEHLGGTPSDIFFHLITSEEVARAGCGGLSASLLSHTIGLPPVAAYGSDALKERVVPSVLSGEKIAALAVTEPGGGSDVASLKCTAFRDGEYYVLNGEKTFITSGMRADFITVAARTNKGSKGAGGVSALLVEANTPGLTRTPLKKMGWWCSDTAHLHFENVRVPVSNLLGVEHEGFKVFMKNFNSERLSMSAAACAYAQACFDEALEWAQERVTFGKSLSQHQVIRHKLVDMALQVNSARTFIYELAWQLEHKHGNPDLLVARTCMAKILSTRAMQFCADQAVQILGGMGYMRGTRSERIYREAKVMIIGGGSEEVLKDLTARQLGI
ncbi:acyl-CoA dehydrogenase family protein [Kordiimonas pumila]|uniref:Acyl-CoA dehydrogenase family protein n=1 Tax=Kordiimonas pumila TaxID=2161677 RepID=A0ABV7D2P9_9PROT